MRTCRLLAALLCLAPCLLHAQEGAVPPPAEAPAKVVVSGTLPDEAARALILGRLRELYGAAQVVDRLEVGGVVPPPKWTENMTRVLDARLTQVHQGRLQVSGTQIALKGKVANEAQRQQIVSAMATVLNPTYTIDNGLVVAAAAQNVLDRALSNRVVEFETASARLTPLGRSILDEMVEAIRRLGNPPVQLVGHTDKAGTRAANVALSLARADTVRSYLVAGGIPAGTLSTFGAGSERPVDSNETAEGRAKNRRIEFRLLPP